MPAILVLSARQDLQGGSKVAAKPLGMRKFSGFLPKAATTTLERPRQQPIYADLSCLAWFSAYIEAAHGAKFTW